MKNKKIKQLMEHGLSHKLLLTMNEGQINQLHKMMVSEIESCFILMCDPC